jgi:serine/threonine protein phosphatase PrpC
LKKELHFFSVCDGYGHDGRLIASSIKKLLPKYLEDELYRNGFTCLPKSLVNCHNQTQKVLAKVNDQNVGGATCCSVLLHGTKLVCSNIGNCKAVLIDKIGKTTPITDDPFEGVINDEESDGGFEKCFRLGESSDMFI